MLKIQMFYYAEPLEVFPKILQKLIQSAMSEPKYLKKILENGLSA